MKETQRAADVRVAQAREPVPLLGGHRLLVGTARFDEHAEALRATFLRAYRWQYIGSGVSNLRFLEILGGMIDAQQSARIQAALAPILG